MKTILKGINIFIFTSTLNCIAQNALFIPEAINGVSFDLNIQNGTTEFYSGITTPTYGINGALLSPTLIINKGEWVTINVTNNLTGSGNSTTMHWHGLRVPAMDDGGPHQVILQGTTWSPSFQILNSAGTFWYHPHGDRKTDLHVSKGLAGMIIVRDSTEAELALPRTYGVDDFPIIVQSKAFDILNQIAISTQMDTSILVNGTAHPYLEAPAQVIRLRLLNASSMRTYNFGFSNGQIFYQIATDGGMKDTSLALTRIQLSPGERSEILINLSAMTGQTVYLKSFASELPEGIYGAIAVGSGADTIPEYTNNFLNGADFNLLQLNIVAPTATPITTIPNALVAYTPFNIISATNYRTFVLDTIRPMFSETPNLAEGPFGINNKTFEMDSINEIVYLNTTEIWTVQNKTLVAHPFHIHGVEFNVIEKSGLLAPPSEKGWKDVVLVMPNDSVKIITKFTDFADDYVPYMYHCHLLHHEDDGMMGSFLVVDTTQSTGILETENNVFHIVAYPNPSKTVWNINGNTPHKIINATLYNTLGEVIDNPLATQNANSFSLNIVNQNLAIGLYILKISTTTNTQSIRLVKE